MKDLHVNHKNHSSKRKSGTWNHIVIDEVFTHDMDALK